ncbi:MAG: hypothetical protein ACREJ4_09445 [Candidatus Methylomirabilaceae bacterium]
MKRTTKYVALDVLQASTVASVREQTGRVIARSVLSTDGGAITEFVRGMGGASRSPSRKAPRRSGCTTCWRCSWIGSSSAIDAGSTPQPTASPLENSIDRRQLFPREHQVPERVDGVHQVGRARNRPERSGSDASRMKGPVFEPGSVLAALNEGVGFFG